MCITDEVLQRVHYMQLEFWLRVEKLLEYVASPLD